MQKRDDHLRQSLREMRISSDEVAAFYSVRGKRRNITLEKLIGSMRKTLGQKVDSFASDLRLERGIDLKKAIGFEVLAEVGKALGSQVGTISLEEVQSMETNPDVADILRAAKQEKNLDPKILINGFQQRMARTFAVEVFQKAGLSERMMEHHAVSILTKGEWDERKKHHYRAATLLARLHSAVIAEACKTLGIQMGPLDD